MAQPVGNIEKLFEYGNGITVLRFKEKAAVSYFSQGVIPEGYLRSNDRNGAQDVVCFTAIPEAKSARDKLEIMIRHNMNAYLSDLVNPINPVTVNANVARVAVITPFEAISGCRNVTQVRRYGYFDERFFPRDIPGLNDEFNVEGVSSGTGGFPAEIRAYFRPASEDRSGIAQGIWEGIIVNHDWYGLLKTWIGKAQSTVNVRELPIYNEKLEMLGTTISR